MSPATEIAFLLDVDNTLLDNDAVQQDLKDYLERNFGPESRDRYWAILEALREEVGYVDYLGALQRYRVEAPSDPRILLLSSFLVDYPFESRLYASALEVVAHLSAWGPTIILSDGDVVFQPRKVQRSGLWQAVDGRVLIYIHKEQMLDDVARRYPARHYVAASRPADGCPVSAVNPISPTRPPRPRCRPPCPGRSTDSAYVAHFNRNRVVIDPACFNGTMRQ